MSSSPTGEDGGVSPAAISAAFLAACRAELAALKPGNVHVHAGGHHMEVAQFEKAAEAAAPFISDPSLELGQRIRAAVEASMAAAHCNTNLGILLLCAPLAAAAVAPGPGTLRERVTCVLSALNQNDADAVYVAIRRANPGGLGRSQQADIALPPTIPLRDAMALAAPRDRIAANYVSGLADIFNDHLPALARLSALATTANSETRPEDIVASLYLSLLMRFPDSHVRRKFGIETAAHVQTLARAIRVDWEPIVTPSAYPALLAFDAFLKTGGWNPGTTADFVVATLFAADLDRLIRY